MTKPLFHRPTRVTAPPTPPEPELIPAPPSLEDQGGAMPLQFLLPLIGEGPWRRAAARYLGAVVATAALLQAGRVPLVRRHLVPTAARLPRVFGVAVDQLARPA